MSRKERKERKERKRRTLDIGDVIEEQVLRTVTSALEAASSVASRALEEAGDVIGGSGGVASEILKEVGQSLRESFGEEIDGLRVTGPHAGWEVGQSIALELDMAMWFLSNKVPTAGLPEELVALVNGVSEDWMTQLPQMLQSIDDPCSVTPALAFLADVLTEADYTQATLEMRELTVEEALIRVIEAAAEFDLEPDLNLPVAEQMADLAAQLTIANYTFLGLETPTEHDMYTRIKNRYLHVARMMRGGDLHLHFWHWLDRFYYQNYYPWRQERLELLEAQEKQAIIALGAQENTGTPPNLNWLPNKNALVAIQGMRKAVLSGFARVFFMAEPFNLPDSSYLIPGLLTVTFSEGHELFEKFHVFTDDLANRVKALSDPTRLTILRLIRTFMAMNTEIAEFLDLAQPTVSVHTKILREAGLIRSHKEGRILRHEIVPSEVRRLLRDLERYLDLAESSSSAEATAAAPQPPEPPEPPVAPQPPEPPVAPQPPEPPVAPQPPEPPEA